MAQPIIGITSNRQVNPEDQLLLQTYVPNGFVLGIQKSGGVPLVLPIGTAELAETYADIIDKLILTGGQHVEPKHYGEPQTIDSADYSPERDTFELALAKAMFKRRKPVFSVCRGTQLVNVVLGGTLFQNIPDHWQNLSPIQPSHQVNLTVGTILAEIFGTAPRVNSFHRQAIKDLAPNLEVIGLSEGDELIEAVRAKDGYPYLGVQWHPELMIDHRDEDLKLFDYVVNKL